MCCPCKKNCPNQTVYVPFVQTWNPCSACPWYGKPYWGVVSPCHGCPHHRGGSGQITWTVTCGSSGEE